MSRLEQSRKIGYSECKRKYYHNNKEKFRKYRKDYYEKRKQQATEVIENLSEIDNCPMAEILFGG